MLVRWTETAANDLTHICDYTEEHFGPAQARRTAIAIYDTRTFCKHCLTVGGKAGSQNPGSNCGEVKTACSTTASALSPSYRQMRRVWG
jgi:ParE toxin of type II toxin-antitoxin system, parDE